MTTGWGWGEGRGELLVDVLEDLFTQYCGAIFIWVDVVPEQSIVYCVAISVQERFQHMNMVDVVDFAKVAC